MEKERRKSIIEVNEVAYLREMLGELLIRELVKTTEVADLDYPKLMNRFLVGNTTVPFEGTAIICIKQVRIEEEIQQYEITVGTHKYSVFSTTIIEHDSDTPPALETIEYLKSRTIPGFVLWADALTSAYASKSTNAPRTYLK